MILTTLEIRQQQWILAITKIKDGKQWQQLHESH
jgi:hypothetical protein